MKRDPIVEVEIARLTSSDLVIIVVAAIVLAALALGVFVEMWG